MSKTQIEILNARISQLRQRRKIAAQAEKYAKLKLQKRQASLVGHALLEMCGGSGTGTEAARAVLSSIIGMLDPDQGTKIRREYLKPKAPTRNPAAEGRYPPDEPFALLFPGKQ